MKSTIKRIRINSCWIAYISIFILFCINNPLWGSNPGANSNNATIKPEIITIIEGESTIITAPWHTVRVAVTNPKIANVQVLTPVQILLQGIKIGSTDLILWSEDEKQIWQRKVIVEMDIPRIKEKLQELFPSSSLEVSQSGEVLIVKGLLRNAEQAVQLHDYLDKLGVQYSDMTSVAGVQQVQLQVRVAEVSRTALRMLGINAFHTDENYFIANRIGSSGGALVPTVNIGPPSGTVAGDTTNFVFQEDVMAGPLITIFAGFPNADFEVFIKALAENQYLRILANPTLVALSGEEANFLAGGEFPIPVVQSTTGAGNAVTIVYKEFGVRLLFRPIVLGDGSIRLFASQEVSDLTDVGAVVVQGFNIPALLTRKAETTLELNSGQTFAMAGLIKYKTSAITSRIPGLGDIPVLGSLFRSVRYAEDETELVILVTASMVEPMSVTTTPTLPGFLHARPNDWELYLEGRIEGKEPAKISPTNAQWLKKIGLDRLLGPGAWDSHDKAISFSKAEADSNAVEIKAIERKEPTVIDSNDTQQKLEGIARGHVEPNVPDPNNKSISPIKDETAIETVDTKSIEVKEPVKRTPTDTYEKLKEIARGSIESGAPNSGDKATPPIQSKTDPNTANTKDTQGNRNVIDSERDTIESTSPSEKQ